MSVTATTSVYQRLIHSSGCAPFPLIVLLLQSCPAGKCGLLGVLFCVSDLHLLCRSNVGLDGGAHVSSTSIHVDARQQLSNAKWVRSFDEKGLSVLMAQSKDERERYHAARVLSLIKNHHMLLVCALAARKVSCKRMLTFSPHARGRSHYFSGTLQRLSTL